ncbi:hypothetical protein BT93_B3173 [Corymbia citriodora subsp. variegata]|nr:hypothetical protein BT93_B3173 [Corymbia citriodora subsp. variegata]
MKNRCHKLAIFFLFPRLFPLACAFILLQRDSERDREIEREWRREEEEAIGHGGSTHQSKWHGHRNYPSPPPAFLVKGPKSLGEIETGMARALFPPKTGVSFSVSASLSSPFCRK